MKIISILYGNKCSLTSKIFCNNMKLSIELIRSFVIQQIARFQFHSTQFHVYRKDNDIGTPVHRT